MEPNLFLIGFQKSGTSSLYDLLIRHPQIYGHIGIKDIPCYVDSNKRLIKSETLQQDYLSNGRNKKYFIHGWVHYINYLTEFEKSTNHLGNKKLIISIREPVDRAFSNYNFSTSLGKESIKPFRKAIAKELEQYNSLSATERGFRSYIGGSRYLKKTQQLFKSFPENSILFISFHDIKNNSEKVLRDLYKFLDLEHIEIPLKAQNRSLTRNPYVLKFYDKVSKCIPRGLKELLPLKYKTRFRYMFRDLLSSKTLKETLLDKDRNEIYSKYFKGEEKELRQLIGSKCYWAKIKDDLE